MVGNVIRGNQIKSASHEKHGGKNERKCFQVLKFSRKKDTVYWSNSFENQVLYQFKHFNNTQKHYNLDDNILNCIFIGFESPGFTAIVVHRIR